MSDSVPPVAVIMPVHNGARFLRETLDSALAQSFTDFALFVVDDASSDGTPEILLDYIGRKVRVLRNATRMGPAGARNRGLDIARSRYIAFLDSDDVAEPARLEAQMAVFERCPDAGLVAARVRVVDEHGRPTGALLGHEGDGATVAPAMLFRNVLATSTVVLERKVLGEERFDCTLAVASDYDLWRRLAHRTAVVCLPDLLVRYRDHGANLTHKHAADTESCLNRIAMRELAYLGITPSVVELATHRSLGSRKIAGTTPFLRSVGTWLRGLEAANEATRVYPRALFGRALAAEWLAACDAVVRGGCWDAWPSILRSRLTARLLTETRTRSGAARLPWRTARGYVRRRWPGLGTRARAIVAARSRA